MRFPVVLFDLDGTVIDSGGIILASMRHATQTVLERAYSDDELMVNVGGPGLEEQMHAFAPEQVDELVRVYRAHNEPLHATLQAFPGVDETLHQLKAEGRRLGVVTAKKRSTVALAFAQLPLAPLFEAVVGGDETVLHKPNPEPLLLGLERLGAHPDEAAYVGDSPYDMQAARAAGMFAVGVTWGRIHDRAKLADADAVIDSPEELLALV
jgi:pyrophosphatase PpaX